MKKVLIIGGNGFVGGQLAKVGMQLGYSCAALDIAESCDVPGITYYRGDITNPHSIQSIFSEFQPDLAINVAAIADIDKAESHRDLAHSINVTGAKFCAQAARDAKCQYVWFSSDAVFSGEDACGYTEESPLAPVNYYGETKRQGEQAILQVNPDAMILRLSLVVGFSVCQGNSFLAGLAKKLESPGTISASTVEIRTPIDVLTLCEAIYELDSLHFKGILHLGGTDSVSRFELTQKAAQIIAGASDRIIPTDVIDPQKAPRHRLGILNVSKAQEILKDTRLLNITETIQRACSTRTL